MFVIYFNTISDVRLSNFRLISKIKIDLIFYCNIQRFFVLFLRIKRQVSSQRFRINEQLTDPL